jgi:guanylate kinase
LYPSKDAIKTKEGITYLFKTDVQDIYKVNNFYNDFSEIYDKISKVDMVEGFVLKRKSGKLEMMTREQNNVGWSVKVRKPTSNYKF